jgi:hypothetical protein
VRETKEKLLEVVIPRPDLLHHHHAPANDPELLEVVIRRSSTRSALI